MTLLPKRLVRWLRLDHLSRRRRRRPVSASRIAPQVPRNRMGSRDLVPPRSRARSKGTRSARNTRIRGFLDDTGRLKGRCLIASYLGHRYFHCRPHIRSVLTLPEPLSALSAGRPAAPRLGMVVIASIRTWRRIVPGVRSRQLASRHHRRRHDRQRLSALPKRVVSTSSMGRPLPETRRPRSCTTPTASASPASSGTAATRRSARSTWRSSSTGCPWRRSS
jgi:hypothetical protein